MSVQPTKSAWRPGVTPAAETVAWIAALGAVALWTAVIVRMHLDPGTMALGPSKKFAVVYGLPLVLLFLVVFDERVARIQALRVALGLAGAVLVAHLAASRISAGSFGVLALAAVLIAAAIIARRPVVGIAILLVVSGSYGDLIAYWNFPYQKTVQAVLAGALIVVAWRTFISGRDYSLRVSGALALITVFVYGTLIQTWLDASNLAAWKGFFSSVWYMVATIVIATAGWRRDTLERAVKMVLVVVVGVGAYAVYRWIVGISVREFIFYGVQPFNYVGTKLKLLGSFPGGQDLGGWTAAVIPFCLGCALTFRDRWRLIALTGAGLCAVALVGSQLRIAVPAVAFGLLTVVLLYERSRAFSGLRLGMTAAAIVAMIALGGVAYAVTGGSQDSSSHGYATLLHPTNRHDQSVSQRFYKWNTAIRDLRHHPFGYGIGTANANSFQYLPTPLSIGSFNVDNGYLRIALEQGFVAMIVYGVMLLVLAIELMVGSARAPTQFSSGIAMGAAGTVVSYIILLIAGAFEDGPRAIPVWVIAGLGLAQFTVRRATQ